MGAVYAAEHVVIGRRAAVKVLKAQYSQDAATVARFFNEARATTAIQHPSIVEVLDVGRMPDGPPYLVMELLAGETLSARLERERLSLDEALYLGCQVTSALAAAHDKGIVHRDLKPDNLFLVGPVGAERVKILDFGIAKLRSDLPQALVETQTGSLIGTPAYMSPEQCRGVSRDIDHRTDIYSLGLILYQMICGRRPFECEGSGDMIVPHLQQPPPSPSTLVPGLPAVIEAALLRALAKAPGDRFADMRAFEQALVEGAPPRSVARAAAWTGTPPSVLGSPPTVMRPTSPTTLSGASGVRDWPVPRPARGRRGWVTVLAAGVAIGAALFVVKLGRKAPRPSPDSTAAALAPPAVVTPAAAVAPPAALAPPAVEPPPARGPSHGRASRGGCAGPGGTDRRESQTVRPVGDREESTRYPGGCSRCSCEDVGSEEARRDGGLVNAAIFALPLCLLAGAAAAQTAPGDAADPRNLEAKKACASGHTQRAIEMLADYYAETGDSMALFNQGRCYQQNELPEQALGRFKEFLRKSDNRERRQEAGRHIAELEAEVQRKRAAAAALPAAGAALVSPAGAPVSGPAYPRSPGTFPQAAGQGGAGLPSVSRSAPPPRRGGGGLRVAGFVFGGVALVSAVAGGIFTAEVLRLNSEVEDAGSNGIPVAYEDIRSRLSSGKTFQTMQWVGYGAALATGVGALICLTLSGGSEGRAVAMLPVVGPGVGGGFLNITF